MKHIGEKLNLACHTFKGHDFYLPVDLEGHIGTDGRRYAELLRKTCAVFFLRIHINKISRYLIDASRTFPPQPPEPGTQSHLWNLFRPEFVRRYSKPLCSDGFRWESLVTLLNPISHFIDSGSAACTRDLIEAQEYLFRETIPKFAIFLDEYVVVLARVCFFVTYILLLAKIGHLSWDKKFELSVLLHQYGTTSPQMALTEIGINCRHLGRVFSECKTKWAKMLLLIEVSISYL